MDTISSPQRGRFQIHQCQDPSCGFRFPIHSSANNPSVIEKCPRCGTPTFTLDLPQDSTLVPLPASVTVEGIFPQPGVGSRPPVEALLDNIRSAFNVGSMFRTADGCGLRYLHLCGMTAKPDNPKVVKTSLGAEYAVPWAYYPDAVSLAVHLKQKGVHLWALEGGEKSVNIFTQELPSLEIPPAPILLIVGNEITGVDPGLLALCEQVVHIPMLGWKRSLNVAVAFGIAVYYLQFLSSIQTGTFNGQVNGEAGDRTVTTSF